MGVGLTKDEAITLFDVLDDAIEVAGAFGLHLEEDVYEGNYDNEHLEAVCANERHRQKLIHIKSKLEEGVK